MANMQLRESLKMISDYRYALDQADIIAVTDQQGIITYVNDNFCKISGYTADELVGQDHRIINSGYHPKEFIRGLWVTIANGKVWKGEIKNKAKSGKFYWVDTTIIPFLNADGKPYQYLAIRHDITKRKEVENELVEINHQLEQRINERTKEAENRRKYFTALIENSFDAVLLIDQNGNIVFQNPAVERIGGYPIEETYGTSAAGFIHPDEMADFTETLHKLALSPSSSVKQQYRIKHKNGHYIWLEGVIANRLNDESIKGFIINYQDVTERKKAEAEILESKQFNEGILASLTSHVGVIDQNGTVLAVNKAWEDFAIGNFEVRIPRSGTGTNYFEKCRKLADEGNITARDALQGMLAVMEKRQEIFELKYFCHAPDIKKWFLLRVMKFISDSPKIVVVHQDISAVIHAEENLQAAHGKIERIFNTLDNSFWGADMVTHKTLYASPGTEKIYGFTANEFLNNSNLYYEVIIPEDQHKIADLYPELHKGNQVRTEYRITHKDGRLRWIEAYMVPILDKEGRLIQLDGITLDITDKKEADEKFMLSQKRFQSLIEKGMDVIVLSGLDRKLLYVSPTIKKILGYEPEEVIGRYSYELMNPEEINDILEASKIVYKSDGGTFTAQLRAQHKNGSWRWVEATMTNMLSDPAVNAIVTNFRDVTDRKLAEDEVKRLNESLEGKVKERTEQLQQVNKELESFSYTVAHDLQAPLRVIKGFADLLVQDRSAGLDEESKYLLQSIMQNAQQMSMLIGGLLEFSRLGRVALSPEEVDMNKEVADIVKLIQADHKDLTAKIKITELPKAKCDINLIKQVWVNLISNAVKYSAKVARPVIEIGGKSDGSRIVYFVKDNGAGFDMAQVHRMFQVFHRLHSKSEFEGTGIGLASVHRIINKHGGEVWAEGAVGKGATFYFSLPA